MRSAFLTQLGLAVGLAVGLAAAQVQEPRFNDSVLLHQPAAATATPTADYRYRRSGADFPEAGSPACNSDGSHHICDPDRVLSAQARRRLVTRLRALETGSSTPCGDAGEQPFELGVVLVGSLEDGWNVQTFTEEVFDRWGVGHPACNNGVLFALSKHDRTNYIKTGKGARAALGDGHAATILGSLQKQLRAGNWDAAVEKAVDRVIDEALVGPFGSWGLKGVLVVAMSMLLAIPAVGWCLGRLGLLTTDFPVNAPNPPNNNLLVNPLIDQRLRHRLAPRGRGGGGGGGRGGGGGGGGFGGGGGGGGGGARGGW
jgi:uncharacterized protein